MTGRRGTTAAERRRAAERFGRSAEWAAVLWLWLHGYRVLARRLRTPAGEVDLLIRRGGVLAAVEVKARRGIAAAPGPHQQRRIARALAWYAGTRAPPGVTAWRFDLMEVAPWRLPRHLRDAWRPPPEL